MNRNSPRLADYLGHILEAIKNILGYTNGMSRAAFMEDGLIQDAVTRNFQIIGEASRNIMRGYPDFVNAHPDLDLTKAWGMRNQVIHAYFDVDYSVVWETIQEDLPRLRQSVAAIIEAKSFGR